MFNRNFAAIHVLQQQLHLVTGDVPEEDDGVLVGVVDEEVAEVGTACREDEFVCFEGFGRGVQGDVCQLVFLEKHLCYNLDLLCRFRRL